jgi:hypothetical protein
VSRIPTLYQAWHLWFEPLIALSGVYHLHWAPEQYFDFMPRSSHYSPASQIVYDQLAASYLLFAAVEALVLRAANNLQVWRAVIFALLLCDAGHMYAAWAEMGTENFFRPWLWRTMDTITMLMNLAPPVLRFAFLLEIGFKWDNRQNKKKKK